MAQKLILSYIYSLNVTLESQECNHMIGGKYTV